MSTAIIPDMAEAIERLIESRVADIFTMLPGKITAVDINAQTVNVQPGVKDVDVHPNTGTVTEASLPTLVGVPYRCPRVGAFFCWLPPAVGDEVMIQFSQRSIDRWRDSGQEQHPADLSVLGMGGAVAVPMLYSDNNALTEVSATEAVLGQEGGMQVRIDSSGNAVIGQPGLAAAKYQKVVTETELKAELTKIAASLTSVPAPTPYEAPTDIGTSKVKAEVP